MRLLQKPFSEALDFIGEHQEYTNRFAEMIVKQVIHNDTHNVAQNNHLTDDEVWSMAGRRVSLKAFRIRMERFVIKKDRSTSSSRPIK